MKTTRCNKSDAAEFYDDSLLSPFAEGEFRYAAEGEYIEGRRKGGKAVCKWFKKGHVNESKFYDQDIRAMELSVELVAKWNEARIIDQCIRVNVPQVWTFAKSDFFEEDTKVLVEPYIENFKKFNSNTGWNDSSTPWPQVMQALSHFTYHTSNGDYLLCDVQGGVDSKSVVLTDPAILSKNIEFGLTDLGPKGISTFFCHHRCNKYCRSNWRKPNDRTQYFLPQEGTSMSGVATMLPPPPRVTMPSGTKSAATAGEAPMLPARSRFPTPSHAMIPPPPPRFTMPSGAMSTSTGGATMAPPPPRSRNDMMSPPAPKRIKRDFRSWLLAQIKQE